MASSSFCPPSEQPQQRKLDASAQSFLDHLGLPSLHPLCDDKKGLLKDEVGNGISDGSKDETEIWNIGKGVFELPNATFHTNATTNGIHSNPNSKPLPHLPQLPPPPSVGTISLLELHDHSLSELLVTATTMTAPTLAMAELWLRFFAVFICPVCLCWMIQRELAVAVSTKKTKSTAKESAIKNSTMSSGKKDNRNQQTFKGTTAKEERDEKMTYLICIIGLASSAVLFTDSLYVYEYGRWFGFSLFALSSILSVKCAASTSASGSMSESKNASIKIASSMNGKSKGEGKGCRDNEGMARTIFQATIFLLITTTIIVYLRSDGGIAMDSALQSILPLSSKASAASTTANNISLSESHRPHEHIPHPGIDLPTIAPKLYHSSHNPLITSILSHWPESSRTYDVANGATPYLVNGDQRTGIPFLVNKIEEQEYVRVWTHNRYDGEYLALDIAFPYSEDGDTTREYTHDLSKPVYLILHGLNGGSHEEYVKDFVQRRRSEGSTVVVFIARGMMDTSMVGWNMFHGARTGDVDVVARVVRRGLRSLADVNNGDGVEKRQILVGVGYSMGAIILSNYVARSGEHCALDAAMAISGGLDMRQQLNFRRSMRLWQPMLTFGLREDMLIGKYARHCKHRLTREQFMSMLRVTSISALDVEAIVNYNSFNNLVHYYTEMSAMGDLEPEFNLFGPSNSGSGSQEKSQKDWGRMANVSIPFAVLQALDDPLVGWRTIGTNDPQGMVDSGNGNVMLVLTKSGGHVGWPLGNNPGKDKWKWMNNAARDFALAVDMAMEKNG